MYQSQLAKKVANIEPQIVEIIDSSLLKINDVLYQVQLDAISVQGQIFAEHGIAGGLYTEKVNNKKYTYFRYSDLDRLRSISRVSNYDEIVPAGDLHSYLLLIPNDNHSDISFIVKSNRVGFSGYVMSSLERKRLIDLLPEYEAAGCKYISYLTDINGKVIVSSKAEDVGLGFRHIFSERYPFLGSFSLQVSESDFGVTSTSIGDSGYGMGWKQVVLGENKFYFVVVAEGDNLDGLQGELSYSVGIAYAVIILIGLFLYISSLLAFYFLNRLVVERVMSVGQGVTGAAFVLGSNGRIMMWNEGMVDLFGVADTHMVGNVTTALHDIVAGVLGEPWLVELLFLSDAEKNEKLSRYDRYEINDDVLYAREVLSINGNNLVLDLMAKPIYSLGGKVVGYLQTFTNVAEYEQFKKDYLEIQTKYDRILNSNPAGFWEWDLKTENIVISKSTIKMLGYGDDVSHGSGLNWWQLIHPDDYQKVITRRDEIVPGKINNLEYRVLSSDGKYRWILSKAIVEQDDRGELYYVGTHLDITRRKKSELIFQVLYNVSMADYLKQGIGRYLETVHDSLRSYNKCENFYVALWQEDKFCFDFIYIRDEMNSSFLSIYNKIDGKSEKEIPGLSGRVMRKGETMMVSSSASEGKEMLGNHPAKSWLGVPLVIGGKTIGVLVIQDYKTPDVFSQQDVYLVEALAEQVTRAIERDQVHDDLFHQATHDNLTKLINREYFLDRGRRLLLREKRSNRFHSLLMLDLNRFKHINDSLGHAVGDAVLIEVSRRIKGELRATDTFARLGGDEFAVLLEEGGVALEVIKVVKRIIVEVEKGMDIDGKNVNLGVSIGAVIDMGRYDSINKVLRDADIAMYEAKTKSSKHFRIFNSRLHNMVQQKIEVESILTNSFVPDEFFVVYQPIVNLQTRTLDGFEALVRWENSKLGFMGPDQFLPVAEESGVITQIDNIVLENVCQDMKWWREESLAFSSLRASINVSRYDLIDKDLASKIVSSILRYGLDLSAIVVEITESGFMENVDVAKLIISELRGQGIRIHMDDFGTGYSSFAHLADLPFDGLKIDKSFLKSAHESHQHHTVLETLLNMSESLKIPAVAEGLESAEQVKLVTELGCQYGQGYYFSKPMTRDKVMDYVLNFDFEKYISKDAS
ncbi:MAG: EAL domain-containing protein [Desulfotalea sp.]